VNDILACGARPLYFLDYYAAGKLFPDVAEQVILGFVKACKENGCALIGGETAEMPGVYKEEDYDIAGTIVGVVDEKRILNGKKVKCGDLLIGLPSTGLHTNGYSLARRVLLEKYSLDAYIDELACPLGDALLMVHRSYLHPIQSLLAKNTSSRSVHALSHITGGGIEGNTMRVIPKGLALKVDWNAWERPALFKMIQRVGNVPEEDMRRTFNLGIGFIAVSDSRGADSVMKALKKVGEKPLILGEVVKSS
jgi:phosphoribosylformylglycinamidine cyclo-ligase